MNLRSELVMPTGTRWLPARVVRIQSPSSVCSRSCAAESNRAGPAHSVQRAHASPTRPNHPLPQLPREAGAEEGEEAEGEGGESEAAGFGAGEDSAMAEGGAASVEG